MHANPFERYDLDPRDGITAITHRLKELAEDANSDAEREEIRKAWEELTLHPTRRLRAALFAHPESRPALGAPPAPRRPETSGVLEEDFALHELAARPSVLASLGVLVHRSRNLDEVPSLEDDPVLEGLP
jgi:hypothetical protein